MNAWSFLLSWSAQYPPELVGFTVSSILHHQGNQNQRHTMQGRPRDNRDMLMRCLTYLTPVHETRAWPKLPLVASPCSERYAYSGCYLQGPRCSFTGTLAAQARPIAHACAALVSDWPRLNLTSTSKSPWLPSTSERGGHSGAKWDD